MRPLHSLLLVALPFAAALASTSCGDSGETTAATSGQGGAAASGSVTSGTGSGGDPVATFCTSVASAYCDAIFACCADPAVLDSLGGSVAACTSQWSADCETDLGPDLHELLDAGSSVLDPAKLAECTATLDALGAGGAACVEPPRLLLLTTCLAAFRGQVPDGEACVTTPDDGSYVECSHGMCHGGVCEAFLKDGDPCNPDVDLCDYTVDLWCNFDGVGGTCGPRKDIGEPCFYGGGGNSYECKSLVCDPGGTCAAPGDAVLCAEGN